MKRKFYVFFFALGTIALILLLAVIFSLVNNPPAKAPPLNSFTDTYTAYRIDTPEGKVIIVDVEYEFCEISSPTLDESDLPFLTVSCWENAKERGTGVEPAWVGRAGKVTEIKTYNVFMGRKQ